MNVGQIYRCQNDQCRSEVRVLKASGVSKENPRCCCGSEMKKPYTAPVLLELPVESKLFVANEVPGD